MESSELQKIYQERERLRRQGLLDDLYLHKALTRQVSGTNEILRRQHQNAEAVAEIRQQRLLALASMSRAFAEIRIDLNPQFSESARAVAQVFADLHKQSMEMAAALVAVTQPHFEALDTFRAVTARIIESVGAQESPIFELSRGIALSLHQNSSAIAEYLEHIRSLNPVITSALTLPTRAYTDFAVRTMDRLGSTDDPEEKLALGQSLTISEGELSASTSSALEIGPDLYEGEGESLIITLPESAYNIFDAIQSDLLDVGRLSHEDTRSVLKIHSSARGLAETARRTLSSLLRCNKTARLHECADIFKSTLHSQESLVVLPGVIARSDEALRDVVMRLFELVYEGAGGQKLRFLKTNGGYLDSGECGIVWNLKALRNKWLGHDPEHGDVTSIKRDYKDIAAHLADLGFARFPRQASEFERLQRTIYERLEKFMNLLEDRIAEAGSC